MKAYFVSGIDTGCGKTYATGVLARRAREAGVNAVTQKFVQTGCEGVSEDILEHRRIMGIGLLPEDLDGTSCPYVFRFPASAHLAARMEGVEIDPSRIAESTRRLSEKYGLVLVEGAGGLMVPVRDDFLTIDYVAGEGVPLIWVVSAKLGSINHALLSVDACMSRGIEIAKLVYNDFPKEDPRLSAETRDFVKKYVLARYPQCAFEEV